MASGTTLNAANLEALGAARLAVLLLDLSAGDAAARRRLRLALAGAAGSGDAAREIGKRLASIAKARGFIDWQKVKPLAAELEAQRRAILDLVAPADPGGVRADVAAGGLRRIGVRAQRRRQRTVGGRLSCRRA